MTKSLVSIIIPVYNSEKYIKKTLESIIENGYFNFEVIVVDDGSTDNSVSIIEEYLHKCGNITLYKQENLNAAIARNRGLEMASGEYVYFIDSDDILLPGMLGKMIDAMQSENSDIVIGNMSEIDSEGRKLAEHQFFESKGISKAPMDFLNILPAPSNKLYKMSIIREKHICFGNVNIGQDLNFYLKYLGCCKNIAFLPESVYSWRTVGTGMTSSVNFNLLDITRCFRDVKRFYIKSDKASDYDDFIRSVEFHHYYRQMDKQMRFSSRKIRKMIVDYFEYAISNIGDISDCKNYEQYKSEYQKCKYKLRMKMIYTSQLYKVFYRIKNGEAY